MKENIIGTQISLLRNKYGMTQEDLAIKLGVTKQTVSNWETGLKTPRMGAIQKLAALFNVKKSFIIEGIANSSDEVTEIYEQLNESNKKEVIGFAKYKLHEQIKQYESNNNITAIRTPTHQNTTDNNEQSNYTLAAHSSDPTKKYTDDEVENIKSTLAKARKKYEDKNK